jgi:hypothetical protein
VLPLSESDAGATAILVDELDAGQLKCPPNSQIIWSGQRRLTATNFSTSNRTQAD